MRCKPGVNELLVTEPGVIGWGGNGGFHALNLALQFGARDLVGLGYDMSLAAGHHWHGRHPAGLTNPTQASVDKWRLNFDAQRAFLDLLPARLVLGSPGSALTAFPKVTLEEALDAAPPDFN